MNYTVKLLGGICIIQFVPSSILLFDLLICSSIHPHWLFAGIDIFVVLLSYPWYDCVILALLMLHMNIDHILGEPNHYQGNAGEHTTTVLLPHKGYKKSDTAGKSTQEQKIYRSTKARVAQYNKQHIYMP
jgi:hypothetical protein